MIPVPSGALFRRTDALPNTPVQSWGTELFASSSTSVSYTHLIAPNDASLGQIIRGQLDGYFVAGKNTDEIHPKLSADVSQNDVFVLQLYFEHGVG